MADLRRSNSGHWIVQDITQYSKALELNTPGFFTLKGKKKMSIDYKKLNDQIVKQAYDHTSAFLTEAQKQKLFQNKIDRAEIMLRARAQFDCLARED